MTETQQRFLRAIAERVPKDQVVEVHLFPAIRQGGVETGMAIVAERPRVADVVVESNGYVAEPSDESIAVETVNEMDASLPIEAEVAPAEATEADDVTVHEPAEAATAADTHADEPPDEGELADDTVVDDVLVEEVPAGETRVIVPRLTVHTARYRLTLKGVDRGKWEVDVVAEADAPLAAVDAVVRGVQRRAGEGPEPDRLTAEAFLDALEAPLATLER